MTATSCGSLQAMAEGYPGAGPEDADLLDLLETFPSARPPLSGADLGARPAAAAALFDRLVAQGNAGRSPPDRRRGALREARAARVLGVASTYLADRIAPGAAVSVFVQPAHGFRLPATRRR